MAQTKISEIIESSLANLREMIDADTVVGKPIDTGTGTVIIPISKVSMGFATGGMDYPGSPVAFLVIKDNGETSILNLGTSSSADGLASFSALLEKSPEILTKIKDVFAKKDANSPVKDAATDTQK